jgi:hypothetical protein
MQRDYRLIKLEPTAVPALRVRGMNGSVLGQQPYRLKPTTFTSQIEGLKPKLFSQAQQLLSLDQFFDNPFVAQNICLVSAPNDGQAKLLAAYMMQYALCNTPSGKALPLWHDLTGGFDNPVLKNSVSCSLLVLNNVGADSTAPKIEKLRDLLETYSDVPRVVVATGTDPFAFFTKHLYLSVHTVVYLTTDLVRKSVDL